MAVPTLSQRALNRALLARQLLLERATVSIPEALSRLGGIQNQYAPNAYLRLWSCLEGVRREDLTLAYEDGSVVQATLMRSTIHTVAGDDYRLFLGAIRRTQHEWGARSTKAPPDLDRSAALARVRAALAAGPMKRPALLALVRDEHLSVRQSLDTDLAILRVPPSGTWERRRADLCALADDVIGAGDVAEEVALPALVRRYLAAFGPASVGDVATFLGMNASPIKALAETLGLRHYRAEDGTDLLDVPDGLLPDADTPAPVRFCRLGTPSCSSMPAGRRCCRRRIGRWSSTSRCRRRTLCSWSTARWPAAGGTTDGEIRLSPFRTLAPAERAALEAEAHRLAQYHA